MSKVDRARFVSSYTRLLISAWSSEEFSGRLDRDPRAALSEIGIKLPDDAVPAIVRTRYDDSRRSLSEDERNGSDRDGGVGIQVELYEVGLRTGRFEFRVPQIPRVETAELSDDDLEAVYGGAVNCSCCPCCCCT